MYLVSLNRYTPRHEWMVRFPLAFICAGEIAKLRWVQAPQWDPPPPPDARGVAWLVCLGLSSHHGS